MSHDFHHQPALQRLEYYLAQPRYNTWLGVRAVSVDDKLQEVTTAFTARPEMSIVSDQLVVHGGILAGLVDVVGHAAVAVWQGAVTPTISLQVDYVAPAAGVEFIIRGRLRRLGRHLGRADVEIYCDQRLVVLGRGTFNTYQQGEQP